jgi:RecB family exonuclease
MGLVPAERTGDHLERALRRVWPEHRQAAFADRNEEGEVGRATLEMLGRFHARQRPKEARVLAREKWDSKRLDSGVEVFGKVGRIDARSTTARICEAIDYKTGQPPRYPGEVHLPDESTAAEVYTLATEAETGRRWQVDQVRLIYLQTEDEVRWQPDREDLVAAEERLTELTKTIREDREFAANPGRHCAWCPWELVCPDAHRVQPGDLEPAADLPF